MVLKTMTKEGPLQWKDYTAELFEKAKAENKIIVLDFTAEWCLNCKALEKGVLNSARVSAALSKENVELLKVDISNDDNDAINQYVNENIDVIKEEAV